VRVSADTLKQGCDVHIAPELQRPAGRSRLRNHCQGPSQPGQMFFEIGAPVVVLPRKLPQSIFEDLHLSGIELLG